MKNAIATNLLKLASSSQTKKIPNRAFERALLASDESFATPLFLLVMDRYGPDALEWAPETIRLELEEDYSLELPKVTLDKIFAAITIVTTNYFYKDVTRFIELCNILAGDDFQPDEFDPADAEEILAAVTEAMLLWPPDESEENKFSEEIVEYIRQVLGEEGIVKPFDVLQIGLNPDLASKLNTDYADDPEMYSAMWSSQEGKTAEMKATYLENMQELLSQISSLSLETGTTETVAQRLRSLINGSVDPQKE